jgi:hypothetical protein
MRRLYELIWAVFFIILAALSIAISTPSWPSTVMIMLGLTALLSILQLRQPSYHGIFWQRINPDLVHWWMAQHSCGLKSVQDNDFSCKSDSNSC